MDHSRKEIASLYNRISQLMNENLQLREDLRGTESFLKERNEQLHQSNCNEARLREERDRTKENLVMVEESYQRLYEENSRRRATFPVPATVALIEGYEAARKRVLKELYAGRKISAIKAAREELHSLLDYNIGLKTTKLAVEKIQTEMDKEIPF